MHEESATERYTSNASLNADTNNTSNAEVKNDRNRTQKERKTICRILAGNYIKAQPLNPAIAFAFYKAGYIEAWGRGIEKMCNECVAEGISKPEYTVHQYDLMLKFTVKTTVSDTVNDTVNDTANDTVNDTETAIYDAIKNDPYVTIAKLMAVVHKSRPTITRNLKLLKEKGKIERVGSDKTGYWKIK